jgi:AcrR family transcriptional regulator
VRKDAQLRRDRLIEAATAIFERDGYGIALDEIAIEAGVGRATLYRNFHDRIGLMEAVLAHKVTMVERFVADHDDDGTLLATFLSRQGLLVSLHASAIQTLIRDNTRKAFVADLSRRSVAILDQVVRRSQRAGTLRVDATAQHLRLATLMLMAVGQEPRIGDYNALDLVGEILLFGLVPRADDLAD